MLSDAAILHPYLKKFDFKKLFNELGWDKFDQSHTIPIGTATFSLQGVAQKRGVQIFVCQSAAKGKIPDHAMRRKIDAETTKLAKEHLLIFVDAKQTTQFWQLVTKSADGASRIGSQTFYENTSGDALLQKLVRVSFTLAEEEKLTLTEVTHRLDDTFLREKVTKKFYDRFKVEHDVFLKFINHIPDAHFQRWYASVMINRLMFLYFIQGKLFLDGEPEYLKKKLDGCQGNFYQDFLCPLFFNGLAKREGERDPKIKALVGKVPYLNGGLFAKHQIENDPHFGHLITIPNEAFQRLFAFFDEFDWTLDERELRSGKEINPDVLGYIFEKYINQKQMGAYYTKEDITEYISKNTILPFLFDQASKNCRVAFEGEYTIWQLLKNDPDAYIYQAVKHGIELPLPEKIAQGLSDVSQREFWNQPAPPEYGLPTEIWREVVARRQRCQEIRKKLTSGEVRSINDFITYNLNIRAFALDVLMTWEGADLIRAFWDAIRTITILDPTCGSGAFLFAALEILKPLYEACLDRMGGFVADADQLGRAKDHQAFRDTLKEVAKHPNRDYFVFKSIIVNNLFGVDIMEEATEICKLRLFLKLAAQVEPDQNKDNLGIEPLPDIDFNIRAGNTLVGFATEAQTQKAVTGRLDYENVWPTIQSKAAAIAKLFEDFQKSQNDLDAAAGYMAGMKAGLRERLTGLRDELDKYLGQQFGKVGKESLAAWKKTAQPFHWFLEFYNVMKGGGFNVIIGNPPYVEYTKKDSKTKKSIMDSYHIKGYDTLNCGNLYAFTIERCVHLCNGSSYSGMIVPSSAFSTGRMRPLTALYAKSSTWFSFYDFRPAKLFDGVNLRLAIFVTKHEAHSSTLLASTYNRWYFDERHDLFGSRISYQRIKLREGMPVKTGKNVESNIYHKIAKCSESIAKIEIGTKHHLYFHDAILYWIRATDFAPSHGDYISSHVKTLSFGDRADCQLACSLMNSSLFYWWWIKISNCRDLNPDDARIFHFPSSLIASKDSIVKLHEKLMADLQMNSQIKVRLQKQTGEVTYREFNPVLSKPIIDKIDCILAKHYGFTDEETDFIINYDIKYRMGRGGDEMEEE